MKLPPHVMQRYVFSRVGARDPSVVIGPSVGEDAAVIDLGDGRVLVVHSDAITGAVETLGWLAVHIVCNDVAVTGARPRWFLVSLLLPENCSEELIDAITKQIDEASRELGIMVVGGHTELTPGIGRPIAGTTAMGIATADRIVRTGGAEVGDLVLMTKTAGIEGTAILCTDFADVLRARGVSEDVIRRGREMLRSVSVVREALLLAERKLVTSMHDPTEGGILGGLTEIAYASGKTIVVWEESVPIARETEEVTKALGLDPLKLISSGALLATVPRDVVDEALSSLKSAGIEVAVIGEVREKSDSLVVLHRRNGKVEKLRDVYVRDELLRLWSELGREASR